MPEPSAESVDRIRDIIFGPKMRDYEQRFETHASDLTRIHAELDRLAEQLAAQAAAQTKALQALRQELRGADNDLRLELKGEVDRLAGQLAEQQAETGASLQALRSELRAADGELREELRRIAQKLTDDKTDRATLGDLFIELGRHVKSGGSLADLLQGLDAGQ